MLSFKKLITFLIIGCFLAITDGFGKTSDTEYVERALQYQDKGELQAAVIELKNALQQNPANAEARLLLGKLYVRLGDGASAQKELELAKVGGISEELVSIPLGTAYLLQGQPQQVLANVWPRSGMRPEIKAEAATLRGNAYQLQNKLNEADKAFQEALLQQPAQVGALLGLARDALLRDQRKEAKQWLDKAQAAAPNKAEVWQLQGDYEQKQANWSAAEAAYNKVLALDARNLTARIGLAVVLLAQNKVDEAGKALAALPAKDRNQSTALYYLALVDFNQKNYALAEERLQELFKRGVNSPQVLYLMGLTQYVLGHLEQADSATQQVLQQFPDSPEARKLKGLITLSKSSLEPDKRQAAIDNLVSQFPQDAQILNAVADALRAQGKPAEATQYLKKVAELEPTSAAARVRLSQALAEQGKPEQAIPQLEKAKELGAQSQDADLLLIDSYFKAKDFDRALTVLQPMLEKDPRNAMLWNLAGVAYAGKGQIDKAQAAFQKVLELVPGDPNAAGNLAQMALGQGDASKARGYYQQALKKNPDDLRLLLGLAELERRQGNKEAYGKQLDEAIKKQPKALQPRLLRAQAYLEAKNPTQARGLLMEVQEAYSINPDFLLQMGNIELVAGDTDAAIQKFNKVLVLQPDAAAAQYWLAAAYGQKGDLKQMREPLTKALTLQPDNPLAEQLLARLLILARNDKEAAQLLQALQDKFPKNPQVIATAGQLALQRGEFQQAVQIAKQGLTLFPDNALLTYGLVQAYRQMDNQSAFFSTAQDWLKKHPQDIQMQWLLANYYSALKRDDEAKAAFIRLLEIAPDNTAALNNLAWMLRQKNPQQARQYAEKALSLAPDDGSVMDTLGVIVLEQGDKQRALELVRKASQQLPQNRDISYHLAKALAANGQKDEARQILRKLLADKTAFDSRQEAETLLKELGG